MGFFSPYFLVPKKSRGMRQILYLHVLKGYITYETILHVDELCIPTRARRDVVFWDSPSCPC